MRILHGLFGSAYLLAACAGPRPATQPDAFTQFLRASGVDVPGSGIDAGRDASRQTAAPAPLVESNTAPTTIATDLEALVRSRGKPIPFDRVFDELQAVPRSRGEFETTTGFRERQAAALARVSPQYLIEAPVDPKYVRYDADRGVLVVATYALANTRLSSDDLFSLFGVLSDLSKGGVTIKYDLDNVDWSLPREETNVGTYEGKNAFGATLQVVKQVAVSRGVFEREGANGESIWSAQRQPYKKDAPPVAFELRVDEEKARAHKAAGVRAAFLVVPTPPFTATGTSHFSPTIRAPYDCTTTLKYVLGDIRCAALYDASGELLAVRPTR